MPSLSRDNRKLLENTVVAARSIAENGAEKALISVGVGQREAPDSLTQQERTLRNQLRAHGRQLGDGRHPSGVQETRHLAQAVAYEHWHRMLFARFLAENDLLMHTEYGIAMSMDEVREAAREQGIDWLTLAMNCAQHMLIEVFRADDPVLRVVLPPETRLELEQMLEHLPVEVFTAEDSLGWVYQFWQSEEKDRVNKSEVKIGADELASVTQLFTEDYMVLFLLHNTLGAWWTARRRAEAKGNELPGYKWTYLRLNEEGAPVVGSLESWPMRLNELRILDPCMGSGHFLAFALPILAKMAEVEQALTPSEAVRSVLTQNLYGLELDARCSQIAAFNIALTAWRLVGRYIPLPPMNLACSGLGINASQESWVGLADDNGILKDTLAELYTTFQKAPTLGSLIDPTRVDQPLLYARFDEVWPLLKEALAAEQKDEESRELAIAAKGVAAAARILAGKFTLVATNVPYLGRGKQSAVLKEYCERVHPNAKLDLATCFVERCLAFCEMGGSCALVTPQNWWFLGSYKTLRHQLLTREQINCIAALGEEAWQAFGARGPAAALAVFERCAPAPEHVMAAIDALPYRKIEEKVIQLRSGKVDLLSQLGQYKNPGSIISLTPNDGASERLEAYASVFQGVSTTDMNRFVRYFWEVTRISDEWEPLHMAPRRRDVHDLCGILFWEGGKGPLSRISTAQKGLQACGKRGVAVAVTRQLFSSPFWGNRFDGTLAAIIPHDPAHLAAIGACIFSNEFHGLVREVDQALSVTESSFGKIRFDLSRWQAVADENYPDDLPSPFSQDPTQWIFEGSPAGSHLPLQVAVSRLLGYRWPRQTGSSFPDSCSLGQDGLERHADSAGFVCFSSIGGNEPASQRLRDLLEDAFGTEWSATKLSNLLGGTPTLEDWLLDEFFAEHCSTFHGRPFIWHVWDGRRDGYHALVNYHRLAAPNGEGKRTLERLIYSSLGDWIGRQRAEVVDGADGAEARLSAAVHLQVELQRILVGEPPYDIFVRWKPLHQQPIGWEPDINDGVRLNIRPWLVAKPYQPSRKDAGILRVIPINLPLGKDRGKEPARDRQDFPWFADSQDRTNDVHLTLDEKRKAQEQRKR